MWPKEFSDRLRQWADLRQRCAAASDSALVLDQINAWWTHSPWTAYYLHWDDQSTWPDPWQLLSDNIYCPVAKGLGILYTITIIDHPLIQDAVLAEVGDDNLVLIDGGKYILNWKDHVVLNTSPIQQPYKHCLWQHTIKTQIL